MFGLTKGNNENEVKHNRVEIMSKFTLYPYLSQTKPNTGNRTDAII